MRKLVSLATLSCVLLSVALAQEAAKEPVRSGPPALADRFRAYREAIAKRDLTTLDDIWADDYTFTNRTGISSPRSSASRTSGLLTPRSSRSGARIRTCASTETRQSSPAVSH